MALLIRAVAPGDIPHVADIYAHAVTHGTASFELQPPDLAEMERRRAALVDAGYPPLAPEQDGVLLGYAYAGAYRPRPAYRSTVEDSVYVAPAAQGGGVGKTLPSALIGACGERDFRLVGGGIGARPSSGSIRLHEALGFQHVGALEPVGYKHGRW